MGWRFALTPVAALLCLQAQAADLIEIYQGAREADPQFRAADYGHQASRELLEQAKSGYLPSVDLSYETSKTHQEILETENPLFTEGSTRFPTDVLTLSLTQPIFRYANYLRIGQARSELKQADAELSMAEQELMLRVAEGYINALIAGNDLDYLKAERTAVEKQLQLARAREKAMLGRVSDSLEAEARLASVMADYSAAEVVLRDSHEALAEMTGELPGSLRRLHPDFPLPPPEPLDVEHWVEAAMEQNWELEAQRQALEVSRSEVQRQGAGHYPTLDLKYQDSVNDTGGTLFGGGSRVRNREWMLSFNLPLYKGGSVSSKTREAVLDHEGRREDLIRLSRQVRREARRSYLEIVNAIERVNALKKEVAAQEEVLKLKRAGYEAALYANLAVLDAERDLFSAKRDYIRARYDYLINGLKLKAVVGTLSEADLDGVNHWLTEEGRSAFRSVVNRRVAFDAGASPGGGESRASVEDRTR
ncbi:MAG: hypothetical protein B0D96_05530 [Candidatus Sedimenticola endophacoides]|nr:MAG: hypothetical protein B0D94_00445 [Candidatus Sedimenticola endophacoides]OQX35954.1 MAG: hypothetical protein B0D96_05530 [Candidatus Sedimenticola endophacoides]OQX45373.1 MAG: hypothetical protein B0D86_03775 [Candidatus Sedimenticola endophacoides]